MRFVMGPFGSEVKRSKLLWSRNTSDSPGGKVSEREPQPTRDWTADFGRQAGAHSPPDLQRKCAKCEEEDKLQRKETCLESAEHVIAPPIVREILNLPGEPLDSKTRAFFEPRFGYDFSRVRVHGDAEAAESARAINAHAYALGAHTVFGKENHSIERKKPLAHELYAMFLVSKNSAWSPKCFLECRP